jgi:lipoate-protein ligase A
MLRLNLTLPTAIENVALDEALLDWAEAGPADQEVLRIWESPEPLVVVGRSSRVAQEINISYCSEQRIRIVRRSSGGAAIVAGPGCLMYAVVLSYQSRPELRDISRAHTFVLDRLATTISNYGIEAARAGTSDLVLNGRKFSGNSLRAKRNHFLYHGTLLYDFDLSLIASCLLMPPRQPDYRGAREHRDFVMNAPLSRQQLTEALDVAWLTTGELTDVPMSRVKDLVDSRFSQNTWNVDYA